jgi:hypothetical protein
MFSKFILRDYGYLLDPDLHYLRQLHYRQHTAKSNTLFIGPFEKFVDWRQGAAVMQKEAVTVMPSCKSGGNVVVA